MDSSYSNVASATHDRHGGDGRQHLEQHLRPVRERIQLRIVRGGREIHLQRVGTGDGGQVLQKTWMGGYLHVGHLWSSTGALLASATFTNESASGWQQVSFSSPVAIQANAVYIVSFSTGGGYFGITTNFFTSGGVTNGPLTGPAQQRHGR